MTSASPTLLFATVGFGLPSVITTACPSTTKTHPSYVAAAVSALRSLVVSHSLVTVEDSPAIPSVAMPGSMTAPVIGKELLSTLASAPLRRQGKAPPVDAFTGEHPDIRFEDWLPTLDGASLWNGWSNLQAI